MSDNLWPRKGRAKLAQLPNPESTSGKLQYLTATSEKFTTDMTIFQMLNGQVIKQKNNTASHTLFSENDFRKFMTLYEQQPINKQNCGK